MALKRSLGMKKIAKLALIRQNSESDERLERKQELKHKGRKRNPFPKALFELTRLFKRSFVELG